MSSETFGRIAAAATFLAILCLPVVGGLLVTFLERKRVRRARAEAFGVCARCSEPLVQRRKSAYRSRYIGKDGLTPVYKYWYEEVIETRCPKCGLTSKEEPLVGRPSGKEKNR
jgi:ssDNA-binding Zn-finger/Zn-ribbon topoisomerase 1